MDCLHRQDFLALDTRGNSKEVDGGERNATDGKDLEQLTVGGFRSSSYCNRRPELSSCVQW